jgi:hypothetical protein
VRSALGYRSLAGGTSPADHATRGGPAANSSNAAGDAGLMSEDVTEDFHGHGKDAQGTSLQGD